MQTEKYYNVKVTKPINDEVIKSRYTEAVFNIIKNRIAISETLEELIRKLECDRSNNDKNCGNL